MLEKLSLNCSNRLSVGCGSGQGLKSPRPSLFQEPRKPGTSARDLLTESFGRDDYRELCELIIKFPGGQVCSSLYKSFKILYQ